MKRQWLCGMEACCLDGLLELERYWWVRVGFRCEGWDLWKVMRSYLRRFLNSGRGMGLPVAFLSPSSEGSLEGVDVRRPQ